MKSEEIPLKPQYLIEIINLIDEGKINQTVGKEVLRESYQTGISPVEIVEKKNLLQIKDGEFLSKVVEEVIKENPKAISDWKKGKEQVLSFLIGQVMRKTKGRADHNLAREILIMALKNLKDEVK